MSKIEDKCKDKGVRLTDQRRIIAKVMSDRKIQIGLAIVAIYIIYSLVK